MLNGFATEAAQQQAVMQVVQFLAYADPPRARAAVDAHLTDPALRAQAERMPEAARNNAPPRATVGFGVSEGITTIRQPRR